MVTFCLFVCDASRSSFRFGVAQPACVAMRAAPAVRTFGLNLVAHGCMALNILSIDECFLMCCPSYAESAPTRHEELPHAGSRLRWVPTVARDS